MTNYDDGRWINEREEDYVYLVVAVKGLESKIIRAYPSEKDAFNESADLNEMDRNGYKHYVEAVPLTQSY